MFLVENQREYLILNLSHYIELSIEQNNYLTKIVNVYTVYDLDAWPKVLLRNFTLKNCLFGATSIVKNIDKEKYVYSGYGIVFDGNGEWGFGNDYGLNGNVYDFSVDYNSIDKSDILNIHKYSMTKNNIKYVQAVYCIVKF